MLLSSIKLENFRQYRGEQTINFSCDEAQNVTVILGDNTSGKTTILQAFNWALYGVANFDTKDFLLNMDVANEMNPGDKEIVEVQISLNHNNTDYIITRTQNYVCNSSGLVTPSQSIPKITYKEEDGQTEMINVFKSAIENILPEDLSNYFFFDGERIGSISTKKDVADAVKGLLGLTVLDNAMQRLNPGSKSSVIGSLNNALDTGGSKEASQASDRISREQERLKVLNENFETVQAQITHYEDRKGRLEDIIRDNQSTADLQKKKEQLEEDIINEEDALNSAYTRLISDFNSNPSLFFAKPLMTRALKLLKSANIIDKGIRNMDSTSIDFIIKRGRCICGQEICDGNDAYKNLLKEKEYLPPQSIGTMIRNFVDQVSAYDSTSDSYLQNVKASYENIYRCKMRIDKWDTEIEEISYEIEGKENVAKYEIELRDIKDRLRNFGIKRDEIIGNMAKCESDIDRYQKLYNSLVTVTEKNKEITEYINYAVAVYKWIKETYDSKEIEIREQLESRVNEIFSRMYHGKRRVEIDKSYNVSLLTRQGNTSLKTDESRGLETVKNFAFISGLVDLARQKISSKLGDDDLALSSEPYPLIMDAPFSNADEIHVGKISEVLPEIAEQVIMVVMSKDWGFAEKVMGDRVGKKYILEKKSETLTYIKEIDK